MKLSFVAALVALLLSPMANAQTRELSFAPYVGYNLDTENAVVGIGLDADLVDIGPFRLATWGDIETQFVSGGSNIQLDLNITPYYEFDKIEIAVGVGFAFERQSFEISPDTSFSETGFNTIIAAKYNGGFFNPFFRFRCSFFDGFDSDFRNDTLFGGFAIPILTY